jgi:phage terminase large subunit GpA-like protein
VDAGLKRQEPGPNYIHFPKWLPPAFFDELGAEVRQKNGTWKKIRARNESFDLCRMIRVGMLALGLDKIRDWNKVPDWLKPLEENSERITREERREVQANVQIANIDDETVSQRPAKTHGALRRRGRGRIAVPSPYVR